MSKALEQYLGVKLLPPEAQKAVDAWDTWLAWLDDAGIPLANGYGPFEEAMERLRRALDA